jgi:hypothetical protein
LLELTFRKRNAKKRDEKTIAALFGTLQKDGGTIIDAIKSVSANKSNNVSKKDISTVLADSEPTTVSPKVKKAFDALKVELSDEEEVTETVEETTVEPEEKVTEPEPVVEAEKVVVEEPKKVEVKESKEKAPAPAETTVKEVEVAKPKEKKSVETEVIEVKIDEVEPTKESAPIVEEKKVEAVITPSAVTEPAVEEKPKEKKSLLSFFSKKPATSTVPAEPVSAAPAKAVKPAPVIEEEVDELDEEPEKKVLTKEEFLKQFQKKAEEE